MFTLLKNFGTGTIVTIVSTVVIILSVTIVFLYKSNNNAKIVNGGMQVEKAILQQNQDYLEKSNVITDQVVSDHVKQTSESKTVTVQLRKESIHDYVTNAKMVNGNQSNKVDATVGADRVTELANSMWKQYCSARPQDLHCTTNRVDQ